MRRLVLVAAVMSLASLVHARETGGVKMDDTLKVGAATLKLNGMAVRKKAIFKVYVGGLYLPAAAAKEQDVVEPDVPKALIMHFVRDVGADKLQGAYLDGFMSNAKEKATRNKDMMNRFLKAVPAMDDGQRITFVYEPGKGSTVTFPGGKVEKFEGKDFADAYLLVFVGREPPTGDLKSGLLGL